MSQVIHQYQFLKNAHCHLVKRAAADAAAEAIKAIAVVADVVHQVLLVADMIVVDHVAAAVLVMDHLHLHLKVLAKVDVHVHLHVVKAKLNFKYHSPNRLWYFFVLRKI